MPKLRSSINQISLVTIIFFLIPWGCARATEKTIVEVNKSTSLGREVFRNVPTELSETQKHALNSSKSIVEQIEQYNRAGSMAQINEVEQLRDVFPTDWAYEALRALINRYSCINGYLDQTYRGNQALSRYEFAAGLNTCLQQIELLIANSQAVSKEDINTLLRLMQEFQAELAILQGRTDGLQARIRELEVTQFTTTTKLIGEAIFGLSSIFAGGTQNTVLGDRVRLELENSFFGRDLLLTRLATGNFPSLVEETDTFAGELAFAEPANNDLSLDVLLYRFRITENTEILLGATGTEADDFVDTVNFLDGDGAVGAISAFGTRNPIYLPPGESGLGIIHRLNEQVKFSVGYLAAAANEPNEGNGLLNGPYSAIAQILFNPTTNLDLALTYVHGYNQSDTETGSTLANLQAFTQTEFGEAVPTINDAYGVDFSWSLSDNVVLGGWAGLSKVTTLSTLGGQIDRGSQDIWNWAVTLALPDFGKEGNLAGIVVGMEPWVADSSIDTFGDDRDTSLHLEAFYQYQLSDNLAIAPGVIWITAPDNNQDNEDLVIGTIRTTFSF